MATIKDVAAHAGVSAATVSHVINETRAVSTEARARVREAIAVLRYRPDGIARSLRVSRTRTIAVLISDVTNPFFAEVVRGIEDTVYARDGRLNLILCNTEEDPERERRCLELVQERRIDGLVIVPSGGNDALLRETAEGGLPMVLADRTAEGVAADAVTVDNRAGAERLVAHLLVQGHRRIGVLHAQLNASSLRERVAGYRDALAAAGIALDESLIVTSPSEIEAAAAAGQRLVGAAEPPTGVFCTNNFMTLGLMKSLLALGKEAPRDVAVVGFDDFPWADAFRPRLTVVAQPAYAIGVEAARLLLDRIARRWTGLPVHTVLETRLIVRDSCGTSLGKC